MVARGRHVVPKPRGKSTGRPPVGDGTCTVRVYLTLPSSLIDRVLSLAEDRTLSGVLRAAIFVLFDLPIPSRCAPVAPRDGVFPGGRIVVTVTPEAAKRYRALGSALQRNDKLVALMTPELLDKTYNLLQRAD